MTDEEFYKNKLIKILNLVTNKTKKEIDFYCDEEIDSIIEQDAWRGTIAIVDLKRKLIIKEKTWYKTNQGHFLFVLAIYADIFNQDAPIICSDKNGLITRHFLDGKWDHQNLVDLIRECTPEEVKEIEDKLREKNND